MSLSRALEPRVLIPVILLAATGWCFIEIADAVRDGEAHVVDMMILQWCREAGLPDRPIGPRWLQEVVRDITALGSTAVLALVVASTTGWLWMAQQRGMAALALLASLGGTVLGQVLKMVFSRARPDEAFHATVVSGYSFPSGHTMMSAVVFLTLAVLVARLAARTRLRVYVVLMACALSILVGLSRIYLGVHWASDVLGGWSVGAAWAVLMWCVAERLQLGREAQSDGALTPAA